MDRIKNRLAIRVGWRISALSAKLQNSTYKAPVTVLSDRLNLCLMTTSLTRTAWMKMSITAVTIVIIRFESNSLMLSPNNKDDHSVAGIPSDTK